MKKILPFIILLSALSVSGSAAFYSVYGLSKLFAGAALQVIIMASSLEIAKLVIATLLHEYWTRLNIMLKIYLTVATVVLVLITSAGIYGFLSNAYQLTANQDKIVTRGIELVDTKQKVFEQSKLEYTTEKESIIESISQLRNSLANPGQVQFVDKRSGKIVTSTSNDPRARKSLEIQLDDAIKRRDELTQKIQIASDSIGEFEVEKIELENNSDAAAELGPLKYISGLTGIPMDRVVNYFLLLIIFVFDPLAIALVLAANFAFKNSKQEYTKTEISEPTSVVFSDVLQPIESESNIVLESSNIQTEDNNIEITKPEKKKPKTDKIIKKRKIVKTYPDGNIETAEVPTDDSAINIVREDFEYTPHLSPEQIRNMSPETIREYLTRKK
jgi:hypothetical protein